MPFLIFFSAVLIGKAVNKVTLQVLSLIVCFSKRLMSRYLILIGKVSTRAADFLRDALDKQKASLFEEVTSEESQPLIGQIWEWTITLMILYFVVSFLNSMVRNHLTDQASKKSKRSSLLK